MAAPDSTSPTLTSLILPDSIDVSAGIASATFGAATLDANTQDVLVTLDRPIVSAERSSSTLILSDDIDSFADFVSLQTLAVKPDMPAGVININRVDLMNKAGYSQAYSTEQLRAANIVTRFEVVDNSDATAFVTAPAVVVEGIDKTIPLRLTVKAGAAASGSVTMAFVTEASRATNGVDVDVPNFSGSYTVSPSGDIVLDMPNITLLDDKASEGVETLSVRIKAPGLIFGSGTDETIVTISIRDNERYGAFDKKELFGADFAETLIGFGGYNRLFGQGGDDVIVGGDGPDTLSGGTGNDTFRNTAQGLNGDTIVDFEAGDRITITDASLAGFAFSLTGNTLSYTGGALTLTSVPQGSLVATANASGGVDLAIATVASRDVRDDFNGDGRSDILWRNSGGALSDWLGQANGGFVGNDANAFAQVPTDWKVAGTGDFNGDGRADILWRNDGGALSNWLGQANGGFVGNDANAFAQVPTDWKVAGTGDFNGDGRADVLWRNDRGALSDWLGTASGGLVGNDANAFASVATDWKVAGTGDFNGDGRDDILWRNADGTLADWLARADGGFTGNDAAFYTRVGLDWKVAGTGDFNGDGRDDVLWRNADGALSNWLATASGGFMANDANAFARVPTDWSVVGTGDYNGDGRDDILWRNDNGALSDWLGTASGGFVGNDGNAFTQVGTNWTVQPSDPLFG